MLFPVSQQLKLRKDLIQLLLRKDNPQFFQAVNQAMATGMFAEENVRGRKAHILRFHNFIRRPFGNHPMLMDPGAMGKRIFPYDCLICLDILTGDVR